MPTRRLEGKAGSAWGSRSYDPWMAWTFLVVAGLLEIVWAIGLKFTDGFTRFWPGMATLLAMLASFYLLSRALQTLPVGTGYAVWTGIGAAGTAIVGMLVLGESASPMRLASLGLIVAGIAGLKLAN
jgi:quaternary ammonium compound-resistance protein SugE